MGRRLAPLGGPACKGPVRKEARKDGKGQGPITFWPFYGNFRLRAADQKKPLRGLVWVSCRGPYEKGVHVREPRTTQKGKKKSLYGEGPYESRFLLGLVRFWTFCPLRGPYRRSGPMAPYGPLREGPLWEGPSLAERPLMGRPVRGENPLRDGLRPFTGDLDGCSCGKDPYRNWAGILAFAS